jgi:sec-independent protein translocase protein TatA
LIPNIGPLEIGFVLLIALIVFGPRKLPQLGRSLGGGLREFRDSVTGSTEKEDDSKPDAIEAGGAPAESAR